MSTLTLTDAAGTPVNRSYPSVGVTPDLAVWKDYTTNGGVAIGAGTATASLRENAQGTERINLKLTLPTLESVAGDDASGFTPPPTKAFDCIGNVELVLPSRASTQNRKDLKAMLIDLLSDAVVTAMVESHTRPA